MKASKPRKRKTVEALQENTTRVKIPPRVTSGRDNKKAGKNDISSTRDDPAVLPFTAVQDLRVADHQLLKEDPLSRHTKKNQEGINAGANLAKMKLQLFPIDERTRVQLEKDGHNPYLELTLRARKKISSVVKHLNNKWGSSTVAVGDVMLLEYNIKLENLSSYKRWSVNDDHSCAGDVYVDIGSPALFRLRYGWFSNFDSRILKETSGATLLGTPLKSQGLEKSCGRIPLMDKNRQFEFSREKFKPNDSSKTANGGVVADMPVNVAVGVVELEGENKSFTHPWEDNLSNLSIGGLLSDVFLLGKINNSDVKSEGIKSNSQQIQLLSSDISIGGLLSEASMQGKIVNNSAKLSETNLNSQLTGDNNDVVLSPIFWDDSFTTLSIGGLLSEASLQAKINCRNKPTKLISDSLDAFNFDGLKSQNQPSKPLTQVCHSSFLDAEETCHAFSFGKSSLAGKNSAVLVAGATPINHNSIFEPNQVLGIKAQLDADLNTQSDHSCQEPKADLLAHPSFNHDEISLGLGGITWTQTESLGGFGISYSALQ